MQCFIDRDLKVSRMSRMQCFAEDECNVSGSRRSGLEVVENSHGEVAKSRENLGRRIRGKHEGPIVIDLTPSRCLGYRDLE